MYKVTIAVLLTLGLVSFLVFNSVSYGAEVYVRIPEGANAREVAHILSSSRLISCRSIFLLATRFSRLDRCIRPGIYRFRLGMWLPEILWVLSQGRIYQLRVTIPEGWRATQIADRLEAAGVTSALDFLVLVKKKKLEGYLFPTTYFFEPNSSAERVTEDMAAKFEQYFTLPMRKRAAELGMSVSEVLTLASIVEREAIKEEEKKTISSVYHNRLRSHRPLEADPTIQYALGYWKPRVTYKDLKYSSPYNTYRHRGLPPGPICSVSVSSLQAVLWPVDTDYLYFVADHHGGHSFHEDYQEFLRSKARKYRD